MLISADFVANMLEYKSVYPEKLQFLLSWVQSKAESLIGRKLESAEYVWQLDGTGKKKIILPAWPVTEVTGIYLDSSRAFATALEEGDYYLDAEAGIISLYNHATPEGDRTVKVTATAGYDDETLPADLKMAFIEAINWNMSRLNDHSFGKTTQNTPDGVNVGYEMVLPLGVQRVLDSYREVRV